MAEIDGGALAFKSVLNNEQMNSAVEETLRRVQGLSDATVEGGKHMDKAFQQTADGIRAALRQIGAACEIHETELAKLEEQYEKLGNEAGVALMAGRDEEYRAIENTRAGIKGEIAVRKQALDEARNLSNELEREAAKREASTRQVEESAEAHQSLRARIRGLREEMALYREAHGDQTEDYRRMSAELGRLQDIQGDIAAQGRVFANDEAKFQGVIQGLSGLSGAFSAATGAVSLFAGENENLQKVMTKVQSVMAIAMGLQSVAQTLNKDSAFHLVTLNGLKEWWAGIVAKATAAETAETAAIVANTAAQQAQSAATAQNTAVQGANTVATGGQAVAATAGSVANFTLAGAFRAVGLAIKSIPGLGWLIAGVTALGAGISYFSNKAKEAKKAQEELSKAMIEGCYKPIGKIEELSAKYTMLGNNIKDKEKFIKDNKKSFEELGVSVKNVHDAENLLVRNKDAFVNAQMAKARAMAYMQTAAEQVKKQLELQAEIDAMSDTSSVYVQTSSYGTGSYVQGRNTAKDKKKKELAERQAETRKLYENAFKEEQKAADEYKRARIKQIDTENVATPAQKLQNGKGEDPFIKMLEKRKSEYERYQKWQNSVNDEVRKASSEEFEKLTEGGKTYEEFLEKLHTKISALAQNDKTSAQLRAIRNELVEVGKTSVLEQFNESLKIEFDGAKNTLEQLRIIEEKRKELANDGTSIDNEKKKILDDAQKGVLQTQKEETATLLENYASYLDKKIKLDLEYNNDITLLEKARAKSTDDQERKNIDAAIARRKEKHKEDSKSLGVEEYGRLLQDYQSFAQKEDAIATDYNVKRQKAAEALAVLEIDLANAKTEHEKEEIRKRIAANKEMVQEMNRAETKERLNIKFDQLKASPEYVRAFEDLDFASSETLQKLIAKFEEVKDSVGENLNPEDVRQYMETIQTMVSELNSRDLFGALRRGYKDLKTAQKEITDSEQALQQIRAKGGAGTQAEEQAIARLNKAKDRYNKKNKEVRQTEIEVQKQVNNLCKSLVEIGGVIGGQAGEIVAIIGDIGSFVMNTIDSVKAVAATGAQAISSVEKASVILAVISAAYQIASKIIGLFTEDDGTAAYESAEKVYRSYIDTLHEVIDAELELMNTMTGKDAQAKYEHAIQLINKTAEAARNLGRQYLDSGASRGFLGIGSSASKGVEQRDSISSEAWHEAREVAKAHNISWETLAGGRMKGLFDLTSEQLKALKQEAPLFFAQLHEDTKKYINDILTADSTIKDTMARFNESLVGVSFDTMRDDFRSSLEDMELDAKKISQNIQEYMRKALINDMFKKSYQGELQKYYDAFAQAMRADSDGGAAITDEEKKALNKLRESVVTGAVAAAEAINKQFEGIGDDADKSLTGAVKGVTEETASIVAGQLNAMRINQGEANNLLQQQLTTLSQIAANTIYNRHLEKLEGIWAIMSGSQNDPLRSKGLK
nr:MAG TPA: Tape measure domain protein [Caudoviricetes sp.]